MDLQGEIKSGGLLRDRPPQLQRLHPSQNYCGLNPAVVDITPTRKRVQFEQPYEGSGRYGMATVIFGLTLFMVSDVLGWPDVDAITAICERYP